MNTPAPELGITSITLIAFCFLQVFSFSRWRATDAALMHLRLYVGSGLMANLLFLLSLFDLTRTLNYHFTIEVTLSMMAIGLGGLTLCSLKRPWSEVRIYWSVQLSLVFTWNLLAFDVQGLATRLGEGPINFGGSLLVQDVVSGLTWLVSLATVTINLLVARRKPRPTQFHNRLRYWLIVALLTAAGGGILFFDPQFIFPLIGFTVLASAAALASYNVLSYQTQDLKLLFSWGLHYLGVMLVISTVTLLGFVTATQLYRYFIDPILLLVLLVVLAVVFANSYQPLYRFSTYVFSKIIFGRTRSEQKLIFQKYNQNVRGLLDVQRLSNTTVHLMVETLNIDRAIVFIRDRVDGYPAFKPVAAVGMNDIPLQPIKAENPLVGYFRKERSIVSQFDLEERPEFETMLSDERQWLSSLGMEMYVPVLRHQNLLGILAFGPQANGLAYSKADHELMTTLADQTALALEGTLLFEQLATINQEVGSLSGQLTVLDQSKSDFLSIASHELRTPLTQIHTYSQLLLDLTEEDLKDEAYVKKVFQGIARGSERIKEVIDLMLDVSAADLGSMHLFVGPVSMKQVYDQAIKPFLHALAERRIALSEEGLDDLPIVEADGTRLVQVLENLVSNAIKYTPDRGQITISGRLTILNEEPGIEISVKDSGVGIDPEYQETIFDKFFRVDDARHHSTSKTNFKGAGPGLGLTLVKAIIEAHHGQISVESIGCDGLNFPGSTFTFIIPLSWARLEAPQLPQSKIVTQPISY